MTYYGQESLRAKENFPLNHRLTDLRLIYAMVEVKKAAARTYAELGVDPDLYQAVTAACDRILAGQADDQFITQALQGGAGTSTHMNVNEVLAAMAAETLGRPVRPIDDVNRGQSTNDVYPTALRIAAIRGVRDLSQECANLQEALQKRENEFDDIQKIGRTEMMDAVPVSLGQEFGAMAQAIARDRWRIYKIEERLRQVNIGGTAVGLSDTADRRYRFRVIEILRQQTGIGLAAAEYPMDVTQNNDVFVEVSGLLKALAVNLTKLAGDLRLMNSGPYGGLGEIHLQPLQKGSSIMPGKVNPVIPEMTMQCAMRAIANDTAITLAASRGEFELNAFLPLIADALLESLHLLTRACAIMREKCIDTLQADPARCQSLLDHSLALATSYVPALGYDTVTRLIQQGGQPEEILAHLEAMKQEKEKGQA
jgi:aspartate ammonia-lyase